ncbi:MAG: hypothetical protein IPK16_24290 [Anaerolineales bacterium]|nr:hypothetical protein [Anaerolineales bacterium]
MSLRLLGVTEFYVNGETAGGDLLGKDLALLYYLAVTGQPQPRTSLSVLLWGDASESARANLRKSISALNRVLGASLVIARDRVALDGKQCTIDTHAFEQLAQEGQDTGNVLLLQSAVDLYHGEFLAGFAVRNAPDYDLWMYQMQEKYRGLAVRHSMPWPGTGAPQRLVKQSPVCNASLPWSLGTKKHTAI